MIARDGTAKITDFGIAKITASDQLTMTGNIVGTPHYMSPEQVQGQPVDGRSDQFSLAVIAFEMLTGEKPYSGEHLTTVVYKIVAEEPAAPHRLNPTLGVAIESVLRKGLSKKPDARYPTCQEFAGALEKACAASKGWKTMPRGGSLNEPTMVDSAKPVVDTAAGTARPPRRSHHHGRTRAAADRGFSAVSAGHPGGGRTAGADRLAGCAVAFQPGAGHQDAGPPPVEPAPPAAAPAPAPAPAPAEPKPSPMPPPATTPAETAPPRNRPRKTRPPNPRRPSPPPSRCRSSAAPRGPPRHWTEIRRRPARRHARWMPRAAATPSPSPCPVIRSSTAKWTWNRARWKRSR